VSKYLEETPENMRNVVVVHIPDGGPGFSEMRMLATDNFDKEPKPILFGHVDPDLCIPTGTMAASVIAKQIMRAVTGELFVEQKDNRDRPKWIRKDYLDYLQAKEQA
jgi:hypothetical protein